MFPDSLATRSLLAFWAQNHVTAVDTGRQKGNTYFWASHPSKDGVCPKCSVTCRPGAWTAGRGLFLCSPGGQHRGLGEVKGRSGRSCPSCLYSPEGASHPPQVPTRGQQETVTGPGWSGPRSQCPHALPKASGPPSSSVLPRPTLAGRPREARKYLEGPDTWPTGAGRRLAPHSLGQPQASAVHTQGARPVSVGLGGAYSGGTAQGDEEGCGRRTTRQGPASYSPVPPQLRHTTRFRRRQGSGLTREQAESSGDRFCCPSRGPEQEPGDHREGCAATTVPASATVRVWPHAAPPTAPGRPSSSS